MPAVEAKTLLSTLKRAVSQAGSVDWDAADADVVNQIQDTAAMLPSTLPLRHSSFAPQVDVHGLLERLLLAVQSSEALLLKSEAVTAGLLQRGDIKALAGSALRALHTEQKARLKALRAMQAWDARRRRDAAVAAAKERLDKAKEALDADAKVEGKPNRATLGPAVQRANAEYVQAQRALRDAMAAITALGEDPEEAEPHRDFATALGDDVLPPPPRDAGESTPGSGGAPTTKRRRSDMYEELDDLGESATKKQAKGGGDAAPATATAKASGAAAAADATAAAAREAAKQERQAQEAERIRQEAEELSRQRQQLAEKRKEAFREAVAALQKVRPRRRRTVRACVSRACAAASAAPPCPPLRE